MNALMHGPEITLDALLFSRERRAEYQKILLDGYGWPLVSLTVNMPGPIKRSAMARGIFDAGVLALREKLAGSVRYLKTRDYPTGFEGFFVVEMDARALKTITCRIEENHPLGRLLDMDVLDVDGRILGRADIGLAARRCMVCGAPGPGCARSRAHGLDELGAAVAAIWQRWTEGQ